MPSISSVIARHRLSPYHGLQFHVQLDYFGTFFAVQRHYRLLAQDKAEQNRISIVSTWPLVVAASCVRMMPRRIHGCLPTSASHQPASIAMIDSGPPSTMSQRNHFVVTIFQRRLVPIQNTPDKNSHPHADRSP